MKTVVAALAVFLSAIAALAAEPITIGETLKLRSKVLGEERTILVSTPPDYAQSQERYPVLYMTDGDAHFTHTRGTVDFLARNLVMPNVIIVAVTNTDRTRDLSPTRASRRLPDGTSREIPNSGGAGRFLDFFEKELIPYVEQHYRTAPYRIFAGHSLGGLFALHAFTTRTELFNAYIAASPALTWDDDYIMGRMSAFLADRRGSGRTLFVTMANEEDGDAKPTRFDRLGTMLGDAKVAGLTWGSLRLADEDHGTVVLRSHYHGLRKIYEGWRLPLGSPGAPFNMTMADIQAHFNGLSTRFGYVILPPEATVNQAGYLLLGQNRIEDAIGVFRGNVLLYASSANVYDSLGEALERAGRTDEAVANYEKAVEAAKKIGDRRLEIFRTNRDRAAAAVNAKKANP